MKKLIQLISTVVISVICTNISLGHPLNLDRFHKLVIFGDSLSDNGNAFARFKIPPPPNFEGRFSNGPIWVDDFPRVARHFGRITAFVKNVGTNFATGGATSADLSTQIKTFLANFQASPKNLYVIWIGADDFKAGISPSIAVQNIHNGIVQLSAAGAKDIVVLNIPDISLTPTVIAGGGSTVHAAKQFVNTANHLLSIQVHLAASNYLVHADVIDINSLFTQIVSKPVAFGFKNNVQAAFDPNTGKVVPDPNDFVFWDGFHPTTHAHFFAAEFIYRSILLSNRTDGLVDNGGMVH